MISPDRDRFVISSAGHLPPVIMPPGEEPRLLGLPADLPVGIGDSEARHNTAVDLTAGTTLVLYTDGLVERRGEVIDIGLDRLRALVRPAPAEQLCAGIVAGMDVKVVEDDIALVAVRITSGD
jgi:serine phosphatase RsbU (regulator of sigma subunit)